MRYRSVKVAASAWAITLGLMGFGAIGSSTAATTQEQMSDLDQAITAGTRLFKEGNSESFRKAVIQFEKALELTRSVKAENEQVLSLLVLGKLYEILGEKQKALNYFNQALQIIDALGDQSSQAMILNHLGEIYSALGRQQQALDSFNQSVKIFQSRSDLTNEAKTLNTIGLLYSASGEQQKAMDYLEQALLLAQVMKNRSVEAMTLNNIGIVYSALSEQKRALNYFERALQIRNDLDERLGRATTLSNMGGVYSALGESNKALTFLKQALPIFQALKNRRGVAMALNTIGVVYNALGKQKQALDSFSQALPIFKTINDPRGAAMTLNNIGGVHQELYENQKALDSFNQALLIFQAMNDPKGNATTLNNIGRLHYALNGYQKAMDNFKQALLILRTIGDQPGEAGALHNIASIYSMWGDKQQALNHYNKALLLFQVIENRKGEATTQNNIGEIYNQLGEYKKALDSYKKALPIFQAVGNRSGEAILFNNLAWMMIGQKQPETAIVFYKKSINIQESLRKNLHELSRETQEVYTSSIAFTYRNLADLLLTQGRTQEAQAILELLKVQETRTYDERQQESSIQIPLHSLESQIWSKIEQQQQFSLSTLESLVNPLTQNRDRITQEMNAMPIAIGNPQAVLKANPNALLIQNLVVGDKLWVLWTNASGNTKTIALKVTQKELTETVETFRKSIASPYSDLNQLKATSQKLHNWLIPPELQTELKNNPQPQLLFSLDHVTRYIPVAALHDGTQYLAQRYTLSNLITMDSDMGDRFSANGQSPNILALGTSKRYGKFSALENVPAELKAIVQNSPSKGIYPGKIQLNEAFTAKSLSENLDPYRVLHIATHGSFNPKSITDSFLLLGNGEKLPITDIAALKPLTTTHLVVLSACETGISGQGQDGTEISGISGYFLRRGAKSVLASLWSVNDASTSLLMQQFYQNLTTPNMTKAQALQKSQQDFINGKLTPTDALKLRSEDFIANIPAHLKPQPIKDYSHPFFWAPFVLTGNNQ